MRPARAFWVIVHRWAGLTMALFLIVAGFTGSFLAFNQELLDATQPWRIVSPPSQSAPLLDPLTLNRAAQAAAPAGYALEGLNLDVAPRRALLVSFAPPEGSDLDYIGVAVDPYRGTAVRLPSESILESWRNIMPFLYRLHYKLAIQDYGIWAFGIAAFIWTIDCFIGFYLTLPPSSLRKAGVARWRWRKHWGKSWRLKLPSPSKYRLNFDLHRAGGLWLWPMLLVFAWSSVGMNLRYEVYNPVMRGLGAESMYEPVPHRAVPPGFKPDWADAYAKARALAKAQNIKIAHEGALYFNYEGSGIFAYQFATPADFTDEDSWSAIHFFPDGRLARTIIADGGLDDGGADKWLTALHRAEIGGVPYRIFVALIGQVITMLSVTGIVVWMKKRSARLLHAERARPTGLLRLQPAE